MNRFILIPLVLVTAVLGFTGCAKKEEWKPPKLLLQEDRLHQTPLIDNITLTEVDAVLLERKDDKGKVIREPLTFPVYGVIKGKTKLMVPVTPAISKDKSGLSSLNIMTDLNISGKYVRLTYDETYIDFDIDSITMFQEYEPVKLLDDMPFYHNGTLYVPLQDVLDAFKINYREDGNKLIIGGTNV